MEIIGTTIAVIIGVVIMALIYALPVMWLWNWLCPDIFGLTELSFLQALGLSLLSGILFKSNISNSSD